MKARCWHLSGKSMDGRVDFSSGWNERRESRRRGSPCGIGFHTFTVEDIWKIMRLGKIGQEQPFKGFSYLHWKILWICCSWGVTDNANQKKHDFLIFTMKRWCKLPCELGSGLHCRQELRRRSHSPSSALWMQRWCWIRSLSGSEKASHLPSSNVSIFPWPGGTLKLFALYTL